MLYVPQRFEATRAQALELIAAFPLTTLINRGNDGWISHLPMYLSDDDTVLMGHFARANPHSEIAHGQLHTAVFQGPNGYISAGWYEDNNQVPTWNYCTVHVTGRLQLIDEPDQVLEIVDTLSEIHESAFDPPWRSDKMDPVRRTQLLQHIRGCRLEIEQIDAKFKLSQNKPADRSAILAGLADQPPQASLLDVMQEALAPRSNP